ncbi:hypothetical protein [Spirillospora sp. NPDC048819]|uniref:hypothetical protein n=1 Tax=Spirillospora sp. NPDC048819 TaxID=3155268 RepID=UPI003409A95E
MESTGSVSGTQGRATRQRFELLVGLMWALRELEQGSVLYMDGKAEPVLSVPVPARRRSLAVPVVQERGGGWSYLWDAARRTPVGAVRVAAEQIAEVGR